MGLIKSLLNNDEKQSEEDEEIENVVDLETDIALDLLSNVRRRETLYLLDEKEDPELVTLNELSVHLAAVENDIDPQEINSQQRKRCYVSIYQTHLPKLKDHEVINWNEEGGSVTPGKEFAGMLELAEYVEERTR